MKQFNQKLTIICTLAVLALVGLIVACAVSPSIGRSEPDASSNEPKEQKSTTRMSDLDEESLDNKILPLEEDTISVLCCGVDKSEKLTDVIMYAVFDTKKKTVNVLRIPRDSFVGSDFPTGKINAIYGHPLEGKDGIESLKSYLEEKWKLDIDYYATITLEGMRNIIDSLGGIKMDVDQTINYLPGQVIYPGEQVLNGEQSEWIIRYRAGYENGDIGRIDMQTKFLGACIDTAKEKGRIKCLSVLVQNYKEVQTDMPLDKMIAVAGNLFELDKSDLNMFVVPGKGAMYYSYAVYAVDKEQLLEILNENFVTAGNELTADALQVATLYTQNGYIPGYTGTDSSNLYDGADEQGSETEGQSNGEWRKLYEYDENGNPLYAYDEAGNPIYHYDENGNIVYIYQLEEQNSRQQDTASDAATDGRSEEKKVTSSNKKENNDEGQPSENDEKSQENKVIKKKSSNQQTEQTEVGQTSQDDDDDDDGRSPRR